MKELIDVKVYVVIFDDMDNWCVEKIYQEEIDAIIYCDTMNKDLPYRLYRYEECELEQKLLDN